MTHDILIRKLGLQEYQKSWEAMQCFTRERDENTCDEIWLLEHPSIFTQGQNGKAAHLIDPGDIPVLMTDRGGQITYHAPGQWIAYTLIDIKRKGWNVRTLVSHLEMAIIDFLKSLHITAHTKTNAPGVYVDQKKIASLGLRIRRGCSFHGVALNVEMDLAPFKRIHPCGFCDLDMTQVSNYAKFYSLDRFATHLWKNLGYTRPFVQNNLRCLP